MNCARCDKEVKPPKVKFCSDKCRNDYNNQRLTDRQCVAVNCTNKLSKIQTMFCSHECKRKHDVPITREFFEDEDRAGFNYAKLTRPLIQSWPAYKTAWAE